MRTRFLFVFLLSLVVMFSSCQKEETKVLSSTSSDGEMIVSVKGERMSKMDPFTVSITMTHEGNDMTATTEVYADKIDESNTSFEWKDGRHCLVTFTHRDGKKNTVPVGVN